MPTSHIAELKWLTQSKSAPSARKSSNSNPTSPASPTVVPTATPGPGTPTPVPGQGPTAVPAGSTTYTVQLGDTLFAIAVRYGIKVNALAQANNITNINLIYEGQNLIIP